MSNFISHEHKTIIIHIPKCGGLSIRHYSGIKFDGPYQGFIPEKFLSYYKVGFCRNPYYRFVSAFKMLKFGSNVSPARIPDLDVDKAIDVLYDNNIGHEDLRDDYQNFKHHAIPITHPFNCIDHADKIIRFENYEADVKKYLVDNNALPLQLLKTNFTDNSIKVDISKKQKSLITDYYRDDFLRFNYEYQT
jgi:hypothetical protein